MWLRPKRVDQRWALACEGFGVRPSLTCKREKEKEREAAGSRTSSLDKEERKSPVHGNGPKARSVAVARVTLQVAIVTWPAQQTLTDLHVLRSPVLASRSPTARLAARQCCAATTAAPTTGKGILEASLRVLSVSLSLCWSSVLRVSQAAVGGCIPACHGDCHLRCLRGVQQSLAA